MMNGWRFFGIFAVVVLGCLLGPETAYAVTDEQVGEAINRMKKFFYEKQDPTMGGWELRSQLEGRKHDVLQIGGETALVVQALLVSGESPQNPKLAKALKYLREVNMQGCYAVAVRAHVWSYLPSEYLSLLETDASWLMDIASRQKLGLFDYSPELAVATDRVDHSATQYGMLGLWQASKRGLKIPRRFWEKWVNHFIEFQRDDGGWNYGSDVENGPSTGSMTAAGLTALYLGQQELFRAQKDPDPKVTQALAKGMQWLNERFNGIDNPNMGGEHKFYYSYGIERVALASGVRFINGRDWYQTCAAQILRELQPNGSVDQTEGFVNTAFALMFLARGRYPVWVNKIQVPGKRWNNHPNDLYFVSRYLSDEREGEINWQVISVDSSQADWLDAPVAFLSSDEALDFTPQQKATIKQYIDQGGLLVANPDSGSQVFTNSIKKLAEELYPQQKLEKLTWDHGLYTSWYRIKSGGDPQVMGLSNGARTLILLLDSDWGFQLQADKDAGKSPVWNLASNLFAYGTNRGVLNNRLVPRIEPRSGRIAVDQIKVGRARYTGNWLPEPAVWDTMGIYSLNRNGLGVSATPAEEGQTLDLANLGSCDYKVVHLSGTDAISLSDAEAEAIKKYVQRGGTILIETVGGRGQFSRNLEKQLSDRFNESPIPLGSADAVITGEGLPDGYDVRRALFRRYAVLKLNPDPRPRLVAFMDDRNRPTIIFSHEDLSLGVIGCGLWDIVGYQPETSRQILTNILLWANKQALMPVQ